MTCKQLNSNCLYLARNDCDHHHDGYRQQRWWKWKRWKQRRNPQLAGTQSHPHFMEKGQKGRRRRPQHSLPVISFQNHFKGNELIHFIVLKFHQGSPRIPEEILPFRWRAPIGADDQRQLLGPGLHHFGRFKPSRRVNGQQGQFGQGNQPPRMDPL